MKTLIEVFCLSRRPSVTQSESHSDREAVESTLKAHQRRKVTGATNSLTIGNTCTQPWASAAVKVTCLDWMMLSARDSSR